MILPLGHDQETLRRLPWMTLTLIGACLLSFLFTSRGAAERLIESRVDEALEHYLAHGDLKLDPALARLAFPEARGAEQLELLGAALRTGAAPSGDPQERARSQAELDRLTAGALASYRAHPLRRWGLRPSAASPTHWVSHLFLHAGWLHLLGNLFVLYLSGPFVEDVWGRGLFCGLYFSAGFAGALGYVLIRPDSTAPLIGASGAVAGVMGAFLFRFARARLRYFYYFGGLLRGTFAAPAVMMLPLWFGHQILVAWLAGEANPGAQAAAWWTQVGGLGLGAGLAWLVHWGRIEERILAPAIDGATSRTLVRHRGVDRALEARRAGDAHRAFELLEREVSRDPGNGEAALAFWQVSIELGRVGEAAPHLLDTIDRLLRAGQEEHALDLWRELKRQVSRPTDDPRWLVRLAEAAAKRSRHEEMLGDLRRALLAAGSRLDGSLALRIARLADDVDPWLAAGALELALSRLDLDRDLRNKIEHLLGVLRQRFRRLTPST